MIELVSRMAGNLVGILFSLLYIGYNAIYPIIYHSFRSGNQLIKLASNLVLTQYEPDLLSDHDRGPVHKYGYGLPGLILCAVPALLFLAAATVVRGLKDNILSLAYGYRTTAWTTMPSQLIEVSENFLKFYSLPGLVLGKICGWAVKLGIWERSLINYARTMHIATQWVRDPKPGPTHNSKRSPWLGIPGSILAITITLPLFYAFWTLGVSLQSFVYLSGSLVNGAINTRVFNGMASDTRFTINKILGAPGYALALLVSLPPAAILFIAYNASLLTIFALAIAVSPAVAAYKAVFRKHRFTKNQDPSLQRLQNLYSALNLWGAFSEGRIIPLNGTGQKGPAIFIRKSMTLNAPSITEEILDEVLIAAKESEIDFDAVSFAVRRVRERHWLSTNDQHILEVGTFILNYLNNCENTVPIGLYKHQHSLVNTFWGVPRSRQHDSDVAALSTHPDIHLKI